MSACSTDGDWVRLECRPFSAGAVPCREDVDQLCCVPDGVNGLRCDRAVPSVRNCEGDDRGRDSGPGFSVFDGIRDGRRCVYRGKTRGVTTLSL